ncbi:MAG TPA: CoF synthetase [Symbiobacteriaceae bacterium]|nr:CoF synthetase [Symbiobacteriaceae bacterium]
MLKDQLVEIFGGAPLEFEGLALEIFKFQYRNSLPYRRFCEARSKRPETVTRWTDIPHLPVTAFKKARIYAGTEPPVHTFLTSGTTAGSEERGAHHFQDVDLYRAAALPVFKRFVLPDVERIPMFMLAMEPAQNPTSSLSWYLQQQAEAFGAPGTGWFVGPEGLQAERLVEALRSVREPVALLGTAFAFVHLVDWMAERGLQLELPPGTRVMETGGFKGKSRTVERSELYGLIRASLGRAVVCVNQYGMTEMSSNCYDQTLSAGSVLKAGPDWVRIRMLHPETLHEVELGQPGIVAVTDLANLYSSAFLLTQDIGIQHPDGFEILGRAPGSEARGCSIAMDQFLAAQRG